MARRWLLFAALNAALYASLLPLWEGFDEAFHYAYVETLATRGALPLPTGGWMARDVEASLKIAPVSAAVRQNLPYSTTFAEYFALDAQARAARQAELRALPPAWRNQVLPSSPPNYEAQQTPLAYVLLAPFDALGHARPLTERVLWLRLLCGIAAALAQTAAALTLARELEFNRASTTLMLALVTLSQMFYASVAHVANDWLAISLSAWFIVALIRCVKQPDRRRVLVLSALVAAGLLTKAYFVAWLGVGLAVVLWKARRQTLVYLLLAVLPAVPAYVRNVVVLGSLSGTMQESAGIGVRATLQAALRLPWGEALAMLARSALWTGNGSFSTFSAATLHVLLALLGLAWGAWIVKRKPAPERVLAAAAGAFIALLLYACCAFYAYWPGTISVSPWYTPVLHLPLAALAASGLDGAAWWRRLVRGALVTGFAYLLAATYLVKLVPMYGGCETARMGMGTLRACYSARTVELLGQTALAPVAVLATLGALMLAAGLTLFGLTRKNSD
jgi:hypothetical protein